MSGVASWLKTQLGPSPIIAISMLVSTACGVLAAFKISPAIPPGIGILILSAVVCGATLYWIIAIGRFLPRVAGDSKRGFRMRRKTVAPGEMTPAIAELEQMIGLATVKREIATLIQRLKVEEARREQGLPVAPISLHMVFAGPPGVGKTVVARLFAAALRDLGVLEKGHLIETDRSGLVAAYVGQTAIKTKGCIAAAMDGVLFIDEAYALTAGEGTSNTFGREAVDTLLKEMEDNRSRLVVIVAGYPDQMGQFLNSNPGLPSRFTKTINFESYTASELVEIFRVTARRDGLHLSEVSDPILRDYFEHVRQRPDFGNARTARTLLERAREAQASRLGPSLSVSGADLVELRPEDINAAVNGDADYINRPRRTSAANSETIPALAELDQMIGLATVKREITTLIQRLKVEEARREQGLSVAPISLHMVFAGPPGVGKTVVARLLAATLRDLGVLQKGHLVETDIAGLVAGYVGQTAIKTKAQIAAAMDGVLFIDEAYALTAREDKGNSFGQEAVDTLLKEMEDNRSRLVVIIAGYPDQMRQFLNSNAGLPSRFTKTINFESYTAQELAEIFRITARRDGLHLAELSDPILQDYFEHVRQRPDFGNARTARTLLERTREAQASRIAPLLGMKGTDLTELRPEDITAAVMAMS